VNVSNKNTTNNGTMLSIIPEKDCRDSRFFPMRFLETHDSSTLPLRLGNTNVIKYAEMVDIWMPRSASALINCAASVLATPEFTSICIQSRRV